MSDSDHPNPPGVLGAFSRFVHSEVSGSMVLLACTVVALAWANSPWADAYDHLLHTKVGFSWGGASLALTLHHWVNDGLMVIFFFVVGLEVKREMVVGELASFNKAILPVAAAVGGMVLPAALYVLVNADGPGARGWGVPMATDIAFALGVLALFGKRVPIGLKVFLTALAIADDLGAVLVIAIYYTEKIQVSALVVAAVFLALLVLANRLRVRRTSIYAILVVGCWLAVFSSGVHATVAGILMAMVVPVRSRMEPNRFLEEAHTQLDCLEKARPTGDSLLSVPAQYDAFEKLRHSTDDVMPPGMVFERSLHPIQAFLILPLFALFNAGVRIDGHVFDILNNPVSIGIMLGLVLGKTLGVTLASWLVTLTGKFDLPEGVTWGQVVGAGALAGVGFTMSLFVSDLAFMSESMVAEAKVGILAASLIAGILGYVVLSKSLPRDGSG